MASRPQPTVGGAQLATRPAQRSSGRPRQPPHTPDRSTCSRDRPVVPSAAARSRLAAGGTPTRSACSSTFASNCGVVQGRLGAAAAAAAAPTSASKLASHGCTTRQERGAFPPHQFVLRCHTRAAALTAGAHLRVAQQPRQLAHAAEEHLRASMVVGSRAAGARGSRRVPGLHPPLHATVAAPAGAFSRRHSAIHRTHVCQAIHVADCQAGVGGQEGQHRRQHRLRGRGWGVKGE